jgi:hypothetical protein
MKTWLKNESTIAKHGMMPITSNFFLKAQIPKSKIMSTFSLVYLDNGYHSKSHSKINNLATKN